MVAVPRFFVPKQSIHGSAASISGADAKHIARVLRMKPEDPIVLCDTEGTDYIGRIREIGEQCVEVSVERCVPSETEPTVQITLFMALPKGDKMDYIIQKTVELGVWRIVPYSAARCIVRLADKDRSRKCERWRRIALEAAKQSGRGVVPEVAEPISFGDMLRQANAAQMPLFFYEKENNRSLKQALTERNFETVSVIIGPEGGFEDSEAEQARELNIPTVSLGKRILRCETAPSCALSAILYQTDNI